MNEGITVQEKTIYKGMPDYDLLDMTRESTLKLTRTEKVRNKEDTERRTAINYG